MSNTEPSQNKNKNILIVGINIGIMLLYTLLFRASGDKYGFIMLAFVLAGHVIVCLIISPFIYSKAFLLSALAVLLIGFSTCYAAFSNR